eukprot:9662031-Ditylum_brightwellii.AAC.1
MNFLTLSGLGVAQKSETRESPEQVENNNTLKDKVRNLDKTLGHVTDMLGEVLKGEGDVQA